MSGILLSSDSDTVGRSGMFCAIATTIEWCKTEAVVDVFQVVKALRVQKPGAVATVVRDLYIVDSKGPAKTSLYIKSE